MNLVSYMNVTVPRLLVKPRIPSIMILQHSMLLAVSGVTK
jgi:hypothetical protein